MAADVHVRVNGDDLEVLWPLHKHHYLTASLDLGSDMTADHLEVSEPVPVSSTGRDLAARALLAGAACTQERVATLLDTSRRSVGRTADADVLAALRNATVVSQARTLLAESASHGSTAEERQAADAWLTRVLRDERQVEHVQRRRGRPRKTAVRKPASRPRHGRRHTENGWSPTTLETLQRHQQRILHRTALLEYVLTAEQRNGVVLTLGDALTELVTDISEAARGTILQPARR
jgi:hypothetical protein